MANRVKWQSWYSLLHIAMIGVLTGLVAIYPAERAGATSGVNAYTIPVAVDTNPDPNIFETKIVAKEATVDIGNGVTAKALTYNGTIPGPELHLKVGDTVIVHFENQLNEVTGIHWHGIELVNASDGTPMTQNQVPAGGKFLYKFKVTRPGMFWYHPHHKSSQNQVFKGLYGTIIVTDPNEAALITAGTLPNAANTKTLALSDITVCKVPGMAPPVGNDTTTFDPALPWVGGGPLPSNPGPSPKDLCETNPLDNDQMPRTNPPGCTTAPCPFAAGEIPNTQRMSGPVGEGQTILTNGMNVGGRGGTPSAPGALAAGAQTYSVLAGQGLRLTVGSEATTRFFRLRFTSAGGTQIPIIRIGGQGGLLDKARKEGGVVSGFDFKYDDGEVLLDPGDRMDVVLVIPAGAAVNDVLTLWTEDFTRTGQGFAKTPTQPVAHFKVTGTAGAPYTISDGTLLRQATGNPVEALPGPTTVLLDPALFVPAKLGMANQEVQFTNHSNILGVNDIHGDHDFPGIDYTNIAHPKSARYAKVGDVLELTLENKTGAHHPFHLHGFSIQPISLTDTQPVPPDPDAPNPDVLTTQPAPPYPFPYKEFRDNIDVPAGYTLTFRVRLDDRALYDGTTLSGALGRWVFHCHIFFHAGYGMISEVVVGNAAGNEAPQVSADNVITTGVNAGQQASMTGKYADRDGNTVTFGASIGSVVKTGTSSGTWTWTYTTTGALNEPRFVYITGTDTTPLKGQALFELDVIPTAKSLKEQVLAQAQALLPGLPKPDADKLNDAIKKLTDSLDPSLWIDGNHIVEKGGQTVFDKEGDAAQRLNDLIKKTSIPDATLQDMIAKLLMADRKLAQTAIDDAIAAAGNAGKIAQAQDELAKAEDEITKGHLNPAIDHFKNAWKKAREAF